MIRGESMTINSVLRCVVLYCFIGGGHNFMLWQLCIECVHMAWSGCVEVEEEHLLGKYMCITHNKT